MAPDEPARDGKAVTYVDQSASGLALNLIDGAVDLEQFTVFRAGRVGGREATIRAAIIGASHVLVFETAGGTLTEVFACTEARGAPSRLLFGALGDLLNATTELTFADGRRYRFKASLEAPSAVERVRRRKTGAGRLRLDFRFPPQADRRARPETIVAITRGSHHLFAETAHYYPQEGHSVITSSQLTWRARG
jgi:hypothetical protein